MNEEVEVTLEEGSGLNHLGDRVKPMQLPATILIGQSQGLHLSRWTDWATITEGNVLQLCCAKRLKSLIPPNIIFKYDLNINLYWTIYTV
jgi:hypothetical protein